MKKVAISSVVLVFAFAACAADPAVQEEDAVEAPAMRGEEISSEREIVDVHGALREAVLPLGDDRIGVIKAANTNCPNFEFAHGMDNENHNNNNNRAGWIGATVSNANTTFKLCAVPASGFHAIRSDNANDNYAVLKLGVRCPTGSVEYARYFDGEDSNSGTSVWVDSAGNGGGQGNLELHFCLFRASPRAPAPYVTWPSIGVPYGVFGSAGLRGTLEAGNVYTDDEDDSNNDSITGDFAGSEGFLQTRFKNGATRLFMARVR